MFDIYVMIRVSTFQSRTIRRCNHWMTHGKGWHYSSTNPAACQAVPVSAEHSRAIYKQAAGSGELI